MDIDKFISSITASTGNHPDRLLQYLNEIQYQYSYISQPAIQLLADKLSLSEAHIRGVVGFYSFLHDKPRGSYDILFSNNITDQMAGNRELLDSLCNKLNVTPGIPRRDGRVTVDTTSCTGMCDQGPAMLVNGWAVTRLDENRIDAIAKLVESQTAIEQWPAEYFQVKDNIQRQDILLLSKVENGSALKSLIEHGAETVLQQIELSDLRGRGGAGFKTGMKWRFCKHAEAEQRFVVCNADEGEPGTFKDRVLLNSYADRVFEGMTVCAGIVGATQGFLYLRAEYRYLRKPLEEVLQKRRDAGLLGDNILDKNGFNFDIEIHMGAGAYICGEETSLIESLEGKRGIPRKRPPFPVTHGYQNQPTVVNNVETFMAAAQITLHGSECFQCCGTEFSTGTKLLSISGDCERPGIYEYPFGVSIQQILEDCGANDTQAIQLSGAAGSTIPADDFGHAVSFEDLATGGSFMVFNKQRDLLDMVRNFSHFFAHESCGFCTPCRVGCSLMQDLLDKVDSGHASEYDLEEIRKIAQLMQATSHCGLGTSAPISVLDTLKKFPHIYQQRLKHSSYEPAFDLDAALQDARDITGRNDAGAHIGTES
ncbi:MAG: NAD(P)H-dependent oxidoreductase subunit E [Gammaproteobacteria bacterium]|nr:NAD(P)H-dependent oxidoreductase subunit E [Gammaproteobacteria bacterium]